MKILKKIFSVKNDGIYKIITILGIKIKRKSLFLMLKKEIENLKKENKKQQYILDKRYEQFLLVLNLVKNGYRVLNKLIDKIDDNELKKYQIDTVFSILHGNCYSLDLNNPKSFNEKIQWLSLNYYANNDEIHKIVDKYEFKDYIKEKLGDGYTIPLLGKWDKPCDIDYDSLPEKFVLKSNWGGDGNQVKIIKNKVELNIDELNKELSKWISFEGNPYYYAFNGPSKGSKPCIIAEEFVEEIEQGNHEFKIFCFNGEPELFYTANYDPNNHANKFFAYYDLDFNRLPFINGTWIDNSSNVQKPAQWNQMLEISKILSKDFPFVRVDFYLTQENLYLGELTFTPGGGLNKYTPVDWDYKMGEMLDISYLMEKKSA